MHSRFPEPEETYELRELERELAYECAVADLNALCGVQDDPDFPGAEWIDLSVVTMGCCGAEVERSARYLELRGLLARHPLHGHLVQVLDFPASDN